MGRQKRKKEKVTKRIPTLTANISALEQGIDLKFGIHNLSTLLREYAKFQSLRQKGLDVRAFFARPIDFSVCTLHPSLHPKCIRPYLGF